MVTKISIQECIKNNTDLKYQCEDILIKLKIISITDFSIYDVVDDDTLNLLYNQLSHTRLIVLSINMENLGSEKVLSPQMIIRDDACYEFKNEIETLLTKNMEKNKNFNFNVELLPGSICKSDYLFLANSGDYYYDDLIVSNNAYLSKF